MILFVNAKYTVAATLPVSITLLQRWYYVNGVPIAFVLR